MKLLKICCSKWVNESRDYRELGVYSEEGAEISVLVKGDIGDKPKKDIVEEYTPNVEWVKIYDKTFW